METNNRQNGESLVVVGFRYQGPVFRKLVKLTKDEMKLLN